jgi:acetyl/propionyl-CoA carboxylase alpha subunit
VSPFASVLVANRGEIALRVIRAARAAGLHTVAVFSDADRHAPHVAAADAAVRLGPAPAAESYLDGEAVLAAAHATGADAVHPGYGFLAESAHFARACETAGLTWIGPPPGAIERMGDKARARELAAEAGVPVVPGFALDGGDPLPRVRAEVGFPLMVKAALGGGGKGMRVVRAEAELAGAVAAAGREAGAAFGDGALLVERLLEPARHVEVQILADAHGHVVHLGERDCSVQRRHQKVVEEAPAPTLDDEVRAELGAAAVRLAAAVGYAGAGTVEFVVARGEFYFLEMNTRLQVEHPVTEEVTGVDLVAWQLRIAAGEPLTFAQTDVRPDGHAIEVRVYAEDPAAGFLPQSGRAGTVRWSDRARVETALASGDVVTTHYDPMLAKVVTRGPTRDAARRRLLAALDDCAVFGLATNLGFLRELIASEEWASAALHTRWLDEHEGAFATADVTPAAVAGAWARATDPGPDDRHPFGRRDGWRLGGPRAPVRVGFEHAGRPLDLVVDVDGATVTHPGGSVAVMPLAAAPGRLLLALDGIARAFAVELEAAAVHVVHRGALFALSEPLAAADRPRAAAGDGELVAPMPGSVLRVDVAEGEAVAAGQTLLILEAMKMETQIAAPFDGEVARLRVAAGDQVAAQQPLAEVTPAGE